MINKSGQAARVFMTSFDIVTLGLFATSKERLIKAMLWTTFVVAGSLLYVTGKDQVIWIPYLLGIVFYVRLLGLTLQKKTSNGIIIFLVLISVFFFYIFIVGCLTFDSLPQLLVGYKAYLLLWSFAFVVAYSDIAEESLLRCWKVFLTIASLQIVATLLQVLIIVPIRGGSYAWDAVVGTFGGDPFSGGNSGGMAIFLIFVFGMILTLHKHKLIPKKTAVFYSLYCIIPILMAEVKVVVPLLPLVIVTIYFRSFIKKPIATTSIFIASLLGGAMVLAVYQTAYYAENNVRNAEEIFEYAFAEVTDDEAFYNVETGRMGRITAIKFWSSYIESEPFENWLFGYGLAESRSKSSIFTHNLARRFNVNIDRSSMTVLLWDVGVIGLSLLLFILIYGCISAFRLSRNSTIPIMHRALLETCATGFVIIIATLPYNKAMIDTPMTQILLMWCLGVVMYWKRKSRVKVF